MDGFDTCCLRLMQYRFAFHNSVALVESKKCVYEVRILMLETYVRELFLFFLIEKERIKVSYIKYIIVCKFNTKNIGIFCSNLILPRFKRYLSFSKLENNTIFGISCIKLENYISSYYLYSNLLNSRESFQSFQDLKDIISRPIQN